jgi:hypothetical protein
LLVKVVLLSGGSDGAQRHGRFDCIAAGSAYQKTQDVHAA